MQNTEKNRIRFSRQVKLMIGAMLVLGFAVSILDIWDNRIEQISEEVGVSQAYQQVYDVTKADLSMDAGEPVLIDLGEADAPTSITEAGDYILFGETKYAVHVEAQDQMVHLILNDVDIRSTSGPAIQVSTAGKVVITLAENTENTLRDSGNYKEYTDSDAAVYSTADLTINGQGTLSVYGNYKDAIHTKEVLKVIDGTVYAKAKRDGMRGNDGIMLMPKELKIECEGNGIRTSNARKEGKGTVEIVSGNHVITAGMNAIVSEGDLIVRNCQVESFSVISDYEVKGKANIEEGCMSKLK